MRCRPFLKYEENNDNLRVLMVDENEHSVTLDSVNKRRYFSFDTVFGDDSTASDLFAAARPVVDLVLNGINGTIFAYGKCIALTIVRICARERESAILFCPPTPQRV